MKKSAPECNIEKKNRIHTLLFYITERCNCRCLHCYMGSRLEYPREFSFKQFVDTALFFKSCGARHIVFLGGEPTLYPYLTEAVREVFNMGYEMIRIFTNGRFQRSLLDKLDPKMVNLLLFSLDGSNPEIDGLLRGRDNFHITVKNIKAAVKQGFKVSITNTVHRSNIGDLKNIILLAKEIGIEMLNFNIFTQNGYGKGKRDWEVSPAEWIQFCSTLEFIADSTPLNFRYPPFYVTPKKLKIYYKEGFRGCVGRLKDRVSIFPDGRLYICPLFYDSDVSFAVCKDNTIIKSNKRCELDFFNEYLYDECSGCAFNKYCRGGCPALNTISDKFSCHGWKKGKDTEYIPICMFWRRVISER